MVIPLFSPSCREHQRRNSQTAKYIRFPPFKCGNYAFCFFHSLHFYPFIYHVSVILVLCFIILVFVFVFYCLSSCFFVLCIFILILCYFPFFCIFFPFSIGCIYWVSIYLILSSFLSYLWHFIHLFKLYDFFFFCLYFLLMFLFPLIFTFLA